MGKEWNLVELLERGLRAESFDGLYSDDGECACLVGNLAPCGEPSPRCAAGYVTKECPEGLDPEAEFFIVPNRPNAAREGES